MLLFTLNRNPEEMFTLCDFLLVFNTILLERTAHTLGQLPFLPHLDIWLPACLPHSG